MEANMATVDQTMLKVQRILAGAMKLNIQLAGDLISINFSDLSTQANVRVIDFGKNKDGEPSSLVRVSAPVLRGVKPSPALYEYMVREAPQRWFGSFNVSEDQATPGAVFIAVGHSLLGDFLDEEELAAALWAVLATADQLDDEMQKRFGGKRWADT
jgi:hypothetical protein